MITPKFTFRKLNGEITLGFPKYDKYIKDLKDGEYIIEVYKKVRTRTDAQNRALYLYFTLLADELNAAGYDMKKTIAQDIDIPWTPETIKENLWRPVMKAYLGIDSTTKLKKLEDIDYIYDIINKVIGERTGVFVPFPSIETWKK